MSVPSQGLEPYTSVPSLNLDPCTCDYLRISLPTSTDSGLTTAFYSNTLQVWLEIHFLRTFEASTDILSQIILLGRSLICSTTFLLTALLSPCRMSVRVIQVLVNDIFVGSSIFINARRDFVVQANRWTSPNLRPLSIRNCFPFLLNILDCVNFGVTLHTRSRSDSSYKCTCTAQTIIGYQVTRQ